MPEQNQNQSGLEAAESARARDRTSHDGSRCSLVALGVTETSRNFGATIGPTHSAGAHGNVRAEEKIKISY